jgi:hypothetical protein
MAKDKSILDEITDNNEGHRQHRERSGELHNEDGRVGGQG